jgi:hypothetical protein
LTTYIPGTSGTGVEDEEIAGMVSFYVLARQGITPDLD